MERTCRVRRLAGVSLIGVVSVLGCDSPVRPLPDGQVIEYSVSGIVTYEDGRPAPDASVGVASGLEANATYQTKTGSDGTYYLRFSQQSPPPSVIHAYAGQDNSSNIRPLDWSAQNAIVKNLRLRAVRALTPGDSMMITIEPDSPLCSWEYGSSMTMLCSWFTVASTTVGTLRVDVRPADSGGILPMLGLDNLGTGATVSVQVSANLVNGRFWFNLAIPASAAPQRYEVTTTILGNH